MPRKAARPSLRVAAETMIESLRSAGRLESVDDLRVASLRGLVAAVSIEPTNAALWRELRATEATLRVVADDTSDALSSLFAALGDTTES